MTVEAGDPSCSAFDPENSVWYDYTPTASGFVQADTFGSDYDTTLSVWTGTVGNLSQVGCNDDSSSLQSKVIWDAAATTTYHIVAGTCCGGGSSGGPRLQRGHECTPIHAQRREDR